MSILNSNNGNSTKLRKSMARIVYERECGKITGLDMTANSTGILHQGKDLVLTGPPSYSITFIEVKVWTWHKERDLIDGSTDKGESVTDAIGDIIAALINLAHRGNIRLIKALTHAYMDIKDRKARMVDGVFVKEDDLLETLD